DPSVPANITLTPTELTFTAVGQTQQLTSAVTDQRGDPFSLATVTWSSTNDAVATVSTTGLVTAQGAGVAQVTAAAGEVTAIVDVSVTQTIATFEKSSGDGQAGNVGAPLALPLVVEANDALGNPIPGLTVTFAVTQGGGSVEPSTATTGPNGQASTSFTLGSTAGQTHQVRATVNGSTTALTFSASAAGQATDVVAFAGNGQRAAAGGAVPIDPAVRIVDSQGNPVPGVAVTFEVTGGGGSVSGGQQTTNSSGVATVGDWILGAGGVNIMTATADGAGLSGNPVLFVATVNASTGFDIKVTYLGQPSSDQLLAFAEAEIRWEALVTGDLPDVPLVAPAGACTDDSPALDETVDDLLILANLVPIDGPLNVLGSAGPCLIRTVGNLPALGIMQFDVDDLELMEGVGVLGDVILHEMGHVLGFGTLWQIQGLLADASLPPTNGTDPHFTGGQAIAAFNTAGGAAYVGEKVPVENTGGEGTADGHWRDSVLTTELMTGFIEAGQNPLSTITVRSLEDQGYTVNVAGADPFTLNLSLRIAGGPRASFHLKNDIVRHPIRMVDGNGRITGEWVR
ncbi:MAG: Ig-like domain-containing protein, partial [Nocardioidaceae bacterium]